MEMEQPIFTIKAHVYHIDPRTKKSWIMASTQAVPVSFFFDTQRHLYRIISVEGTKAVINSTVSPTMVLNKTSNKFLQWSDTRANMVYGLGFPLESDLTQFIDKFDEVKQIAVEKAASSDAVPSEVSGKSSSAANSTCGHTVAPSSSKSPPPPDTSTRPSMSQLLNSGVPGICSAGAAAAAAAAAGDKMVKKMSHSHHGSSSSGAAGLASTGAALMQNNESQLVEQLKTENEKLIRALHQSSINVKKWEAELQ